MRLAYRQPADGITGKIERDEFRRVFTAQVLECPALHNRKENLLWIRVARRSRLDLSFRSSRPRQRALGRGSGTVARARILDALIEHHADIRAERALHFDRFLRRKHVLGAIEMRAEADAFIADLSQIREAKDLIASRIGQNPALPRHEPVQPAHAANQLVPGA